MEWNNWIHGLEGGKTADKGIYWETIIVIKGEDETDQIRPNTGSVKRMGIVSGVRIEVKSTKPEGQYMYLNKPIFRY